MIPCLATITSVQVSGPTTLRLTFGDGLTGTVNLETTILASGPLFTPLQDPAFFALVRIAPEAGTITWPNGADLDPDVLYHAVKAGLDVQAAREKLGEGYREQGAGSREQGAGSCKQ
jgi:hypothetical protein